MEKINLAEIAKGCVRLDDIAGIRRLLQSNQPMFWSWGAHNFVNFGNKFLKFSVNGNHHKGYVYLCVNGRDLFDIYLTSSHGNIKEVIKDIFVEDLVKTIDDKIERIPEYKH